MWHFDRIPASEYDKINQLWEQQDFIGLAFIYTEYNVIPGPLSPCCAAAQIKQWTEYAVARVTNRPSGEDDPEVLQSDESTKPS